MNYEEFFCKDGSSSIGKQLLADIVSQLKQKHLVAQVEDGYAPRASISIELPNVTDVTTGEEVSIINMVPAEFKAFFFERLAEALEAYLGEDGNRLLKSYWGQPITDPVLSRLQGDLARLEADRRASGDGELWQVVAAHFGLSEGSFLEPSHSDQK
ncbi:hypothetical protein IB237_23510 [Agrobacterium sp. AGB01]|uniref:hypothetical protein n=1 Tax=Agrobacterium sp. AGB01 TaxID=2769302 RepID=UPI00177F8C1A|nr:hypothetical protein [Agrobacterium sp. AGB01]MBD9390173.1 hypothetical protein [Agrobacterium sp. AGB01]